MTRDQRIFAWLARHPWPVLVAGLVAVIVPALFLPSLRKDTRNDAFMPSDHPAIVSRDRIRSVFGLADPMVVAIVRDGPAGVFTPHTLALVDRLTTAIRALPEIDADRVKSLATEHAIVGEEGGLRVDRLMEAPPTDANEVARVRRLVLGQRPYRGTLVAEDGTATLIVAELHDEHDAQRAYDAIRRLVDIVPVVDETLHVAGEGASDGYVGAYIDADAQRLNPLAVLVIVAVLGLAYRTVVGVLVPCLVAAGALATTLGVMAATGTPFYLITSAMTVILIGIAVCDAIHILGDFYERRSLSPSTASNDTVVATMTAMWRPVTITSFTSMAGFLAMGLSTFMPPLRAFGLFGALGVGTALLLSLVVVPALLVVLPGRASPAFRLGIADGFGRAIGAAGFLVSRRPRTVLAATVVLAALAAHGTTMVRLDDERIRSFQPAEPIVLADRTINDRLAGTNHLDILVASDEPGALYDPRSLRLIERLQSELESLPRVRRTVSIVDSVKQMHQAMHGDDPAFYAVPSDRNLIAQYFLLYDMAGDAADFDDVVDGSLRRANVRVYMNRGRWSDFEHVVEPARDFARRTFAGTGLTVTVSGSGTARYERSVELRRDHPRGVALACVAVWLSTAIAFRSVVAGLLCLLPVGLAVLATYALMGWTGIWLGLGTSMAAAIAIGLGVDFSVHTLGRLQSATRDEGLTLEDALARLYPTTGRALLFNVAALVLGFGVLAASSVPAVGNFGLLVAVCITAGFLASLTLLPAATLVARPRVLTAAHQDVVATASDSLLRSAQ